MTIGRIGGPMLKENLIRQGVDLSFETNLLYLDVNNLRVGVNTATPNVAMDINGVTRFKSNLQIDGSNISTYAGNGNITLSPNGTGKLVVAYLTANRIPYATTGNAITDSTNLTFDGTTLTTTGITLPGTANLVVGNIRIQSDSIFSNVVNSDIRLDPAGTGNVIIETTSITPWQILFAGAAKEVLSNANLTFDTSNLILNGNANVTTLKTNTITSTTTNGNIALNPDGTGNLILTKATEYRVMFTGPNLQVLTDNTLKYDGSFLVLGNINAQSSTNTITTNSGNLRLTATNRVVFPATNSIKLPVGDTSERPTPVAGDFRFNSDTATLEFYTGTDWNQVQPQVINIFESFDGDGSTTIFTLSQITTSNGAFINLNGVVQLPGVAYSITSNILTFTEAPAVGDKIDVRYISLANEISLQQLADNDTTITVSDFNTAANVTINGSLQFQVNSTTTKVNGNFATTAPVTKTNDFTLATGENFVIVNKTGSGCTVTLPSASSNTGRQVTFKTLQAQTLISASSNVCPIDSATPGTAILTNVVGKWAILVSDGTNWVIMASN
jgi:hypothetical protein